MRKLLSILLLGIVLSSCNLVTRKYGGKENVTMKPNEVLMNVTWKENNMWILTQDTVTYEHYFREYSLLGVLQGEVIIHYAKPEPK